MMEKYAERVMVELMSALKISRKEGVLVVNPIDWSFP